MGLLVHPSFAEEWKSGDLIKTKGPVELRKAPQEGSKSWGTLPEETVLTFEGQEKNGFVSVSVELEDGTVKMGWVPENTIETPEEIQAKKSLQEIEKEKPQVRRKRVEVPTDEALLLRREQSFSFGAHGGPNFSFALPEVTGLLHKGIGFSGGGFVGTYLGRDYPLRFEVNFNLFNGDNDEVTSLPLSVNFVDLAALAGFSAKAFEISAGLQYSLCIGIGSVPAQISLPNPSDLSTPGLVLAGTYRLGGDQGIAYFIRARYNLGFVSSPVHYQAISLLFGFDITG